MQHFGSHVNFSSMEFASIVKVLYAFSYASDISPHFSTGYLSLITFAHYTCNLFRSEAYKFTSVIC